MKHINKVQNFQIEDIDGCEFGYAPSLGKILISHYWDDEGMPTGMIQAVYSDGSYSVVKPEEAQQNIDSGKWLVFRQSSEDAQKTISDLSTRLQFHDDMFDKDYQAIEQLIAEKNRLRKALEGRDILINRTLSTLVNLLNFPFTQSNDDSKYVKQSIDDAISYIRANLGEEVES